MSDYQIYEFSMITFNGIVYGNSCFAYMSQWEHGQAPAAFILYLNAYLDVSQA